MFKRDQLFVMANGQYVTRNVGTAVIECGEFKTVDEVVFAQPGDLSLLGARTLEGFNAVVDARKRKLGMRRGQAKRSATMMMTSGKVSGAIVSSRCRRQDCRYASPSGER